MAGALVLVPMLCCAIHRIGNNRWSGISPFVSSKENSAMGRRLASTGSCTTFLLKLRCSLLATVDLVDVFFVEIGRSPIVLGTALNADELELHVESNEPNRTIRLVPQVVVSTLTSLIDVDDVYVSSSSMLTERNTRNPFGEGRSIVILTPLFENGRTTPKSWGKLQSASKLLVQSLFRIITVLMVPFFCLCLVWMNVIDYALKVELLNVMTEWIVWKHSLRENVTD